MWEIITFAASGIFSAFVKLWAMRQKDEQERLLAAIRLTEENRQAIKEAREYGKKSRGFSFTRRIIALSTIFSVIVLPKLISAYCVLYSTCKGASVWISSKYTTGGFWPFIKPTELEKWTELSGIVITQLDIFLVMAITGLYFGASIVKR